MPRHDDFHFQMRDSPSHSRHASDTAPWLSQIRDLTTWTKPYPTSDFTNSTRQLVHTQTCHVMSSPKSMESLQGRPESPGYHPGFPGSLPEKYEQRRSGWQNCKSVIRNSICPSSPHEAAHKPHVGPPPDGGLTAWLQVLGSYFLFFNTWGLINAFGVFQTYYKEDLISSSTNSTIAWIGTLTSFLLCASPITWGPVFDIGNPRLLILFGSFSVVFGIFMTSLCTEYWQLMLAQGICCGIGGGALFITATSVIPSYFSTKRALAMGICASGSSLGGIIYPIIFTYTVRNLGFGWSVRIIAFIALATLIVPCIVIKPRARPSGPRRILNPTILREVPFQIMNIATFFGFVGQYIPYFFIEQFASTHNIPSHLQFWMLIVLNTGSIPGRILPSLIADRYFHPLTVLFTTTLSASILAFAWTAIEASTPGLVIWCLLYGFCSGAFVSLQGAAVASMTSDLRTIGTRFGINMFAGALGILIGSPVAGAIFPVSWAGMQVFCGGTLAASTIAIAATRIALRFQVAAERRKKNGGDGGGKVVECGPQSAPV